MARGDEGGGRGKGGGRDGPEAERRRLAHRLARIEGQVASLRRQLEAAPVDEAFLIQLAAVRGALSQSAVVALEGWIAGALEGEGSNVTREHLAQALRALVRQS